MPKFSVGDIDIYFNSNENVGVTEVSLPARGRQMYKVSIENSIVICIENDVKVNKYLSNSFKRLEQGGFSNYLYFSTLKSTK